MKKVSAIEIFRWCSFIILALVSLFFIYNLSITLAIESLEKFVIVAGAIGLEFFKLFSIITANTYSYVGKQLGIKVKKRAFLYFTYIWVSLYSVMASFGYSMVAVDKMTTSITVLNHSANISLEKENIKADNDSISEYKNTKISYENSKVAYINELVGASPTDRDAINKKIADIDKKAEIVQSKIDALTDKKTISQANIDNYTKQDLGNTQSTKRTMYDVIHDVINIPAKTIAFIILLVFSTSVELGIFTTSPHANKIDNMSVGEEEAITNEKKKIVPEKKKEPLKKPITPIIPKEIVRAIIEEEPIIKEEIKDELVIQEIKQPEIKTEIVVDKGVPIPEETRQSIGGTSSLFQPSTPPEVIHNPVENKIDVQKITKPENRAEEILQTLDEDRPIITQKAKQMANKL